MREVKYVAQKAKSSFMRELLPSSTVACEINNDDFIPCYRHQP